MSTLEETDVQYIKCLKPNNFQMSGFVNESFLTMQMKANGILDILKLDFQGYCIKYPLGEFAKMVTTNTFDCLQCVFKDSMHVGKKFVYFNEDAYYGFEILKFFARSSATRKVQRCWINYKVRRKTAAVKIQKFYREVLVKRTNNTIEEMIDLRNKSGEVFIAQASSSTNLTADQFTSSCMKAEEYLRVHHVAASYEWEPLSLYLEKIYNFLQTKKFKRVLFFGNHIISYNRLAEVPVRLHLTKSCIPYSNLLPKSELAKGLTDIF